MSWQQPPPVSVLPSAPFLPGRSISRQNLEDGCSANDDISLGNKKVAATGIVEYNVVSGKTRYEYQNRAR